MSFGVEFVDIEVCPFCGGLATFSTEQKYAVSCADNVCLIIYSEESLEEAIDGWNEYCELSEEDRKEIG